MKEPTRRSGFDCACNYLSYQNRTEFEVREYLNKKNFEYEEINEIIKKLIEYNYLNDELYIKNAIRENYFGKKYGKEKIIHKLKEKGIREKYLNWVKEKYPEKVDIECAEYQIKKGLEKYRKEPWIQKKRKIQTYMTQKGFSQSLIDSMKVKIEEEMIKNTDEKAEYENLQKKADKISKYYIRKGYTGYGLKRRIMNNLMAKGFGYYSIKEIIKSGNWEDENKEE